LKALVLSGGGSKNSWAAGCIKHLLGDQQNNYQILCGISSGAINCAFLAQFKTGQEQEASERLCELWLKIKSKDIYKRFFPFGRFHCLWRLGFFDSSPMHQLINENISLDKIRASGKSVNVGVVSLTSGKYKIFDQTSDHFIKAVLASASFPVAFEPVKIGDEVFTDGGVKVITPISTAISLGATEIDAIVTSPEIRDKKFIHKLSITDIMSRSFDLSTEKIMSNDVEKALAYNKLAEAGLVDNKIVKLNIIRPKYNLIEDFLDFSPDKIKKMMDLGYQDALENTQNKY
jgi:NTE family protein